MALHFAAMFERFTERARRVLFFARYEASQLGTPVIDSEHLLLGLLREGKGVTSRIFTRAGLAVDEFRQEIEQQTTLHEKIPTSVEIPFSPAAKRALRATEEEADRLLHHYIGTEHLLLGLLRDDTTVACRLLNEHGIRPEKVREEIVLLLNEQDPATMEDVPPTTSVLTLGLLVSLMDAHEPAGHTTSRRRDHFTAKGFTLRELLAQLLNIDAQRIELPPDLDGPQRYECRLRLPEGDLPLTDQQVLDRLTRHLGLALARERRAIDAYVLTAPGGDSRLRHVSSERHGAGVAGGSIELSTVAGSLDSASPVNESLHSIGPASLSGASMADLARTLEEWLQRPVVDQTELRDRYDIEVAGTYPGVEPFVAALQDQLGLTLTPGRPEVEVVVVKRIVRSQ